MYTLYSIDRDDCVNSFQRERKKTRQIKSMLGEKTASFVHEYNKQKQPDCTNHLVWCTEEPHYH